MKKLFYLLLCVILYPAKAQINTDSLVKSNNDFSINFYNELIKGQTENIIFSPISLSSSLLFAYAGAKNSTALQFIMLPKISTTK